jgi:hypothetical protein
METLQNSEGFFISSLMGEVGRVSWGIIGNKNDFYYFDLKHYPSPVWAPPLPRLPTSRFTYSLYLIKFAPWFPWATLSFIAVSVVWQINRIIVFGILQVRHAYAIDCKNRSSKLGANGKNNKVNKEKNGKI